MAAVDRASGRLQTREAHAAQAHRTLLIVLEAHAERAERAQCAEVVVAVSEAAQLTGAIRQRRQDQRAVRDAPITWHRHAALEWAFLAANEQAGKRHGGVA